VKRWRRALVWSLLAVVPTSCLGGQTGQPQAAACEAKQVSAGEKWGDLTVAERARAFEGHYSATLQWFAEPPTDSSQTPVAAHDSISIDVSYDGTDARTDCSMSMLQIPVHVEVSTSESNFHESGVVDLRLESAASLSGQLELHGMHAAIDADLVGVASGASPSGTVVPIEGDAPGGWAQFPGTEPAAGGGGAGP
jgi:hypothetical protein